ncbi:hypothetical protein Y032_0031g2342 [Ancylostoma ceylanicum]|nr:hypothetical protein Y032_0031g2342 [Ancylostoma ceylanicum]
MLRYRVYTLTSSQRAALVRARRVEIERRHVRSQDATSVEYRDNDTTERTNNSIEQYGASEYEERTNNPLLMATDELLASLVEDEISGLSHSQRKESFALSCIRARNGLKFSCEDEERLRSDILGSSTVREKWYCCVCNGQLASRINECHNRACPRLRSQIKRYRTVRHMCIATVDITSQLIHVLSHNIDDIAYVHQTIHNKHLMPQFMDSRGLSDFQTATTVLPIAVALGMFSDPIAATLVLGICYVTRELDSFALCQEELEELSSFIGTLHKLYFAVLGVAGAIFKSHLFFVHAKEDLLVRGSPMESSTCGFEKLHGYNCLMMLCGKSEILIMPFCRCLKDAAGARNTRGYLRKSIERSAFSITARPMKYHIACSSVKS